MRCPCKLLQLQADLTRTLNTTVKKWPKCCSPLATTARPKAKASASHGCAVPLWCGVIKVAKALAKTFGNLASLVPFSPKAFWCSWHGKKGTAERCNCHTLHPQNVSRARNLGIHTWDFLIHRQANRKSVKSPCSSRRTTGVSYRCK